MPQPVKKGTPKVKKAVVKRVKPKDPRLPKPPKKTPVPRSKRPHPEYGTSKLEERFAREFLDKLGVHYIYQYKAESIGRYFDFYLPEVNLIIEVDGDYFHGYGLLYEQKNKMQKHAEWVDRQKDTWALAHCIPILRFWEHDINDNPQKVRKILSEYIGKCGEKYRKELEKKKRH